MTRPPSRPARLASLLLLGGLAVAGCMGTPVTPDEPRADAITALPDGLSVALSQGRTVTFRQGAAGVVEILVEDGATRSRVRVLASEAHANGLRTFWGDFQVEPRGRATFTAPFDRPRVSLFNTDDRDLRGALERTLPPGARTTVESVREALDSLYSGGASVPRTAGSALARRPDDVLVGEQLLANIGIGGGGR